jgi:hypothetical protein
MGWKVTFDGTKRDVSPEDRAAELEKDRYTSIWEGGTVVEVDVLSVETLDEIASQETPRSTWWTVSNFPLLVGLRMWRVACALAAHAGVNAPNKPANGPEAEQLLEQFEETVAIEERPMVDGNPPTPDIPETGSGSGVLGDSNGPQTSPDDNPSEISSPSSGPNKTTANDRDRRLTTEGSRR